MKHTHISPQTIVSINTARRLALSPPPLQHGPRSHAAKAASMGLYGGKLQDHLNQLRNIDYALIERRIMAHLR